MASCRLEAAQNAKIGAFAQQLARGGIGFGICIEMQAVGSEPFGKSGVVLDEAGQPARLHKIDQPSGMIFVNRRAVPAKQNAGGIGGGERLRELSLERCRRLCWKLKIEPTAMLEFGHDHGLPLRRSR